LIQQSLSTPPQAIDSSRQDVHGKSKKETPPLSDSDGNSSDSENDVTHASTKAQPVTRPQIDTFGAWREVLKKMLEPDDVPLDKQLVPGKRCNMVTDYSICVIAYTERRPKN
jgi:hypothetical protein